MEEDFMREECDRLNPVFFHYITEKRPYVVMKYAMTADGNIASRTGASKWITGEEARARVQELRWTYMGIMAGIGTVLADDPLLTVREEGRRSPVRIICDSRLRIPEDCRICRTALVHIPRLLSAPWMRLEQITWRNVSGCRRRASMWFQFQVKRDRWIWGG